MENLGMDGVTAEIFAVANSVKSKLDRSTPMAGAIDQEHGYLKSLKTSTNRVKRILLFLLLFPHFQKSL